MLLAFVWNLLINLIPSSSTDLGFCEDVSVAVQVAPLTDPQAINAQDPLSSVFAYDVMIKVVLARLAGVRMCLNCPYQWEISRW